MEYLQENGVNLAIFAGVVLVLYLASRALWQWYSTRDERALEKQLRDAIACGDLRRAGDIQVRRGLLREASRVYERGGEHVRAGNALAKLGDDKGAAEAYEKGEDFARAAPHFRKAGEHARAAACFERSSKREDRATAAACFIAAKEFLRGARIYQDLEEYEKAADAFAQVEELDSLDLALTMLENAALKAEPERRKQLWRRAAEMAVKLGAHARAARAFDEAGDLAKAAEIYENALKQPDWAAALYAEIGDYAAVERLSVAAGGQATILERRETRARARGDKALAEDLANQLQDIRKSSVVAEPTERLGGGMMPISKTSPNSTERFELLGELGRGGMGVVYKARDTRLGRLVALKFLPSDIEDGSPLLRLFRREGRAAAALSHPGIVTVYDVGTIDGREFIAMEFVEGTTLDRILSTSGPLPIEEGLELMTAVLEAVAFAHGNNVIHRDLKPANIMRSKTGVKVMDFGLAKVMGSHSTAPQTIIGGTPGYMAPEQFSGQADHRSDVFSLGATFYELFTGVLPGNTGQPVGMATSYPTARERSPKLPPRLSDLIARCLEPDRSMRPQDVVTVLREIREIRTSLRNVADELRAFVETEEPSQRTPSRERAPAESVRNVPRGPIVEVVEQRAQRGKDR